MQINTTGEWQAARDPAGRELSWKLNADGICSHVVCTLSTQLVGLPYYWSVWLVLKSSWGSWHYRNKNWRIQCLNSCIQFLLNARNRIRWYFSSHIHSTTISTMVSWLPLDLFLRSSFCFRGFVAVSIWTCKVFSLLWISKIWQISLGNVKNYSSKLNSNVFDRLYLPCQISMITFLQTSNMKYNI